MRNRLGVIRTVLESPFPERGKTAPEIRSRQIPPGRRIKQEVESYPTSLSIYYSGQNDRIHGVCNFPAFFF